MNGKNLLFLKKLKKEAPEFFYRFMREEHNLKTLTELRMFAEAIEALTEVVEKES